MLNESMPFLWDVDTDVRFVWLLVGHLHSSNTIMNIDIQSAFTVKVFHATNDSLLLFTYNKFLVSGV